MMDRWQKLGKKNGIDLEQNLSEDKSFLAQLDLLSNLQMQFLEKDEKVMQLTSQVEEYKRNREEEKAKRSNALRKKIRAATLTLRTTIRLASQKGPSRLQSPEMSIKRDTSSVGMKKEASSLEERLAKLEAEFDIEKQRELEITKELESSCKLQYEMLWEEALHSKVSKDMLRDQNNLLQVLGLLLTLYSSPQK